MVLVGKTAYGQVDVVKWSIEKDNTDRTDGCVKKYLWDIKKFDIIGAEIQELGERQEYKCK